MANLDDTLKLPCGAVLPNRLGKSAMSEGMADDGNRVSRGLVTLYDRWGRGGLGLIITGNVMIDRGALGEPGNVVLDDDRDMRLLKEWVQAGTGQGSHLWVQLNHPGRQVPSFLAKRPVAPSSIAIPGMTGMGFNRPRALEEHEISHIIARFQRSAEVARKAGFTGVQIHGAHGYLVSQFLSPLSNKRRDKWGGSLENRLRFPLEVYRGIRQAVGKDVPVSIKLNSADFQRGGFSESESLEAVQALAEAGIDLIEISGGNYESAAMTGVIKKESTRQREAYFLDFAEKVRKKTNVPLMVTGGFRTRQAMIDALAGGSIDIAGLARPVAIEPDFAKQILAGRNEPSKVKAIKTGVSGIDNAGFLEIGWYGIQLRRMGEGKEPDPDMSAWEAVARLGLSMGLGAFRRTRA